MPGVIDENGNRYGRLLVLSRAENDCYGKARWHCKCDCGNETTVSGEGLRRVHTQSCGCLARSYQLPKGEAAFNVLFNRMRNDAKQHGRVWELTREQVRALTKQPCYYCGKPPSQIVRYYSSEYTYSGVDRMDNDVGYIESNCVPCCKHCNRAKHTKTVEQFRAGM